ncbi:MAG: winged helix-turn-helix domain-containing protein [Gammaproteobacteria bacterium]|nr:winged helix-turn-helix domain-containing protein [Gammaproteobacteria bacterium]
MNYQFDRYSLDTDRYQLCREGEPVAVEPLVFDLLVYLLQNRGRVVSRDELLNQLWAGKVVTDAALAARLKDARKAVGDSGSRQSVIKTHHGRGYQFVAELDDSGEKSGEGQQSPALTLPEVPSIAVLPFDNLGSDPEQDYLSDGIVEDVITALSHFAGLFVIARNSSFSYKGKATDARQIARELGVRYLLQGSIRRSANRIRINGQLINALDGNQLWAERFEGDLDDLFELQDEITRKIVGSIAPQIELAEVERGRRLQPGNLSSYELALKAKSLTYDAFRFGDADRLRIAIETADAALELDERNTHALWILGLALMEQFTYQWGDDYEDALARAMQVAEKLISADPSHAGGYILRGGINTYRREYDLATADYEYGLSLNPNSSIHLIHAAWGESLAGLTTEARAHAELGLRLSPKEYDLFLGYAYLGLLQASFAERDFEQAIKWGRLSIQMHATAPVRRALMTACCALQGRPDEARQHAAALAGFSPDFIPSLMRGDLVLYRATESNHLLVEGLRQAEAG